MARTQLRSIKVPIVMGVVTVVLSIALMIGWIGVIVRNIDLTQRVAANSWLMAAGIVSIVLIVTVLVLFMFFLSREIREGQRQDRFIDSVTHELKSPLASLKLCVQTLDRRQLAPDQRADLHRMMLDDIDRLGAFIDDILAASRIGYEGEVAHELIDLGALADRAASRVVARHRADPARVVVEVEPAGLALFTERTSLEVVLRNLLDNAVKYSEPPQSVRLRIERVADRMVRFEVVDQGIGIAPEHLNHIFDRFYRVPTEAVNRRRGTGLGLYVASALVRGLGGLLQVASAGAGRGTTMRFELPLRSPEPGEVGAAGAPAGPDALRPSPSAGSGPAG